MGSGLFSVSLLLQNGYGGKGKEDVMSTRCTALKLFSIYVDIDEAYYSDDDVGYERYLRNT